MPKTNARLREIAPGVLAERLATEVHLFWNPADDSASIAFQTSEHLCVAGQWQPLVPDAVGGQVLELNLADIRTRTFASGLNDPVTGVDLGGVTPAGLMLLIKNAFDKLYNEAQGE
ncbi:hypothetical protein [Microbulbifer sp. TYP-18]|uniref:hypothetical protein n=1 Tax=Microbulbifer sp. TYP-18 TaxID=3230024 RepID=UPI0034C5D62E